MSPAASRCVAPLDDAGERLCGRPATERRTVEGIVMPLCAEHAAEFDREQTEDREPTSGPRSN